MITNNANMLSHQLTGKDMAYTMTDPWLEQIEGHSELVSILKEAGVLSDTGTWVDYPNFSKMEDALLRANAEDLYGKSQVLKTLRQIETEGNRVLSITKSMMKYGIAGRHLSKLAFTQLQGVSEEKSVDIWRRLNDQKLITAQGEISETFTVTSGVDVGDDVVLNAQVKQLLAQAPRVKRVPIDIHKLLNDVAELVLGDTKKKGIVVSKKWDTHNVITVKGMDQQLRQAFLNIMTNSIQAMEAKEGAKELRLSTTLTTFISSKTQQNCSGIKIDFSDSGIGISEKNIELIKAPFFTTKSPTGGQNIGLGVSIMYEIVLHHGGLIDIQSVEGEGATFSVFLPIA